MNPWAFVSFGLVAALISAFFWFAVMPNGPTGVGVVVTLLFTAAALVLLLVGCIGAGVQVGRQNQRQND